MALIPFVANHEDLSTDRGYQFKFRCDKCGNGFMSTFQTSVTGVAGGLLRAAGSIFGGILGNASHSAWEIQRVVGGKEHDEALQKAVAEGKGYFKQCSHCGQWVCPEVCWNASRGLCESCAPDERETVATAQAQALRDQIHEKARAAPLASHIDIEERATATCPHCGAAAKGGKFCHECGKSLASKVACPACQASVDAGVKFCPECGHALGSR